MKKQRILIVGGVAGGASAAGRLRRLSEDVEIIMFEKGEHVSFANCGLTYHIQGLIQKREQLFVMTPQKLKDIMNVDVRIRNQVISIDRKAQTVKIYDQIKKQTYEEYYDKLIISTGAYPFIPSISGLEQIFSFTLRTLNDMDGIIKYIEEKQPRKVLVIGGGFIGLVTSEALYYKGLQVTMVQKSS